MSFDAVAWALHQPNLTDGEFRLLMRLAWMADNDHACHPGRKFLVSKCEASESALNRHMVGLEAKGLVVREARVNEKGAQTSNRYRLLVDTVHMGPSGSVHIVSKPLPENGHPPLPNSGQAPSPKSGTKKTKGKENTSDEVLRERRAALGITDALWDDWVEMRKAKRKPVTPGVAKVNLDRLEALKAQGWSLDGIIRRTIEHAWDSFFPPNERALADDPSLRAEKPSSAPTARAFKPVAFESETASAIRERLWRLADPEVYDRWLAGVHIVVEDGAVLIHAGSLAATYLRSDGKIDGWLRSACLGVLGRDNWQRIEIVAERAE